MPDRDWQKDWDLLHHPEHYPVEADFCLADEEADCEAKRAWEYWLQRVRELEQALHLAYRALTEGMDDVPAGERNPACAELRRQAKRATREVMRWEEDAE